MSIAPLAVLGIAQAAFSFFDTLAGGSTHQVRQAAVQTQPQETIWHQLGRQANVRSMTKEELSEISSALYDSGAITLFDHAILSFDASLSPQGEAGNAQFTKADASGRVDWMAEFHARFAAHRAQGDDQGAQSDQRILEMLGRLAAGSRGMTSIRI